MRGASTWTMLIARPAYHAHQHQFAIAPRRPMSQGLIEMARAGSVRCHSHRFTLQGRHGAPTLPGALVQQNAEALAALALIQIVRLAHIRLWRSPARNEVEHGPLDPGICQGDLCQRQLGRAATTCLSGPQRARPNPVGRPSRLRERHVTVRPSSLTATHPSRRRLDGGWPRGQIRKDDRRCRMIQGMFEIMERCRNDAEIAWRRLASRPGGTLRTGHTLERYQTPSTAPLLLAGATSRTWSRREARRSRRATASGNSSGGIQEPPLDPAIREELDDLSPAARPQSGSDN